MMHRPRIAVVAGYMPFFDEIMPPGYAADREAFGARAAEAVASLGEVTYLGLVRDHETGEAIGRRLAESQADAVLVVPTMATPAGYLWKVLGPNPDIPVILWAAHETEIVPPDYDMVALCRHSSNVGALMIGNILSREGHAFRAVVGPRDRDDIRAEVRQALGAAALAGSLRRARIGRLGMPLDGYDNVDADPAALKQATGIDIVDIPLAEWEDACHSVSDAEVRTVTEASKVRYSIDDCGRPNEVNSAARMAAALKMIVARHDLSAGTLNCRGAYGVGNTRIASLGCLALTHATSDGVPFTCTGDVVTAIAMLVGRRLGGAALYCELDAIDETRDAFLCANTGEGDAAWCTPGTSCRVFASGADSGRRAPGCTIHQTLGRGAATMLGFTPRAGAPGGFTMIAMQGEVLDPPRVALSVTSAWFRSELRPMRAAMANWIEAGATHHGSLSPGHLASQVATVAHFLSIGATHV